MQANNTSDAWLLVGLNDSAAASAFNLMISTIALSRELILALLNIP